MPIEAAESVLFAKLQPVADGIVDAGLAELRDQAPDMDEPQAFQPAILGEQTQEPAELFLGGLGAAIWSSPGLPVVISELCYRFGRGDLLLAHFAQGKKCGKFPPSRASAWRHSASF